MAVASPFPTFLLYLYGGFLVAWGFIRLLRQARRAPSGGPPKGEPRRFVASISVLVIGFALVGAGLGIDAVRRARENTKSMTYQVSVGINGTGPVVLILPAPKDSRFWDVFNVTNGTSSLRLSHTSTDTFLVLDAAGNVTFTVHTAFFAPSFNRSMTHTGYYDVAEPFGGPVNALIQMSPANIGTTVVLVLDIGFDEWCYGYSYTLTAVVPEGSAEYPFSPSGVAIKC